MHAAINNKQPAEPESLTTTTGLFTALLLCIIFLVPCQKISQAAAMVAATSISIAHLVRLERMAQTVAVSPSAKPTVAAAVSQHDVIDDCQLVGLMGDELTLRVHYRLSPTRNQPIYAGAWLYDANKQAIDAGYKPVAIAAFPAGTVDVVLVLPQQEFQAQYAVTFLMESGRPVFVNGRFALPYRWENGVLSVTNDIQKAKVGGAAVPALQSKQQFCETYANTAVAQFNDAIANNLPGIVPPVWSADTTAHYNWCLGVSHEQAEQGNSLRQSHLDRYVVVDSPGMSPIQKPGIKIIDSTSPIKPKPNKKLDPGLGP